MTNKSTFALKHFSRALAAILLLSIVATEAHALPRFALPRGEVDCRGCHFNAMGGGLRTAGGEGFEINRLPMWKRGETFSGAISEGIRIGIDMRSQFMSLSQTRPLYMDSAGFITSVKRTDTTTTIKGGFAMALPLYIGADLTQAIQFYGKYDFFSSAWEGWGMIHFFHGSGEIFESSDAIVDGWLRLGAFLPSFGIRFDDHTAYSRGGNSNKSGFENAGMIWAPNYRDIGAEIGLNLFDHVMLTADFLNGNERQPNSVFQALPPTQAKPAIAARLVAGSEIIEDLLGAEIGASIYSHPYTADSKSLIKPLEDSTINMSILAVHGGFRVGPLSLLVEADFGKNIMSKDAVARVRDKANALVVEATGFLTEGLILMGRYDTYHDKFNEWDTTARAFVEQPGVDIKSRISIGLQWFPVRFIEFRPEVRFVTSEVPGPGSPYTSTGLSWAGNSGGQSLPPTGPVGPPREERKETTFLLQTHIYF